MQISNIARTAITGPDKFPKISQPGEISVAVDPPVIGKAIPSARNDLYGDNVSAPFIQDTRRAKVREVARVSQRRKFFYIFNC